MSFLPFDIVHSLDIAMFAAACVMLMTGYPVAFTLAGVALVFAFFGHLAGAPITLAALPSRIFGQMTNEVLVAVPLFIFMGVVLERSRVAEDLLESMGRLFGRMNGGLALAVTLVGALLAASTGIVGATVVTMGLMSLPTMLRNGYAPSLACGGIAAAGTLGQIIPPSIVLVILGDQLASAYQKAQMEMGNFAPDTVSVGDLFAGALLPGLMLVGLYIAWQMTVAIVSPRSAPAMIAEDDEGGDIDLFGSLMPPVVLIVAVLGSILAGIATPTEAAGVGAAGALLLAGNRLKDGPSRAVMLAFASLIGLLALTAFVDLRPMRDTIPTGDFVGIVVAVILSGLFAGSFALVLFRLTRSGMLGDVSRQGVRITSMVFAIVIGASFFSLVFRDLGGEELVKSALSGLPGGTLGAVIAVMAVMFVLGFFLDFLEIVFVVVPLVAPVLLKMEMPDGEMMSPVWLAVMMAVNLQTSFLTPPFGFALFYLRGVAPDEVRTSAIYKGIIPYVLLQMGALALVWFVPQIATWLPKLIYG
ncbi:TRAP transporter large permease subunit [Breoghania sp.]|uniref:TRAP transporter large permease n=1 Tax=Breoghania sp. TaxID=2065378 RepID=UPI002AA82BF3|nr:TRAP transporter large permease subunit [Breoghania sp.]